MRPDAATRSVMPWRIAASLTRVRAFCAACAARAVAPVVGTMAGVGVAAAIVLTPPLAEAKATSESPYGYDRTWNSALRYIRVDQGYKVTEKDEANGYLLFDYRPPDGGKVTPGSLEVVRGKDQEAPVNVVVQLPKMPRYHEQVLVDGLMAKMRAEYGDPPPRKKKKEADPPPPEAPDAGPDTAS